MRGSARIFLVGFLWVVGACPLLAQDSDEASVTAQATVAIALQPAAMDADEWERRVAELKQWIDDYTRWREWHELYRNRPEHGLVGFRARKPRPDPPAWLIQDCAVLIEAADPLAAGCALVKEWQTDDPAGLTRQLAVTRTQGEAVNKTVWWERVHLDVFWPMTQTQGSVYGVVGVHATFQVAGRFQVFAAPGAMLMNLPSGSRSREWQPAADWGITYRLFDFRFPGTGQWNSLHFNFAKAWVLAGDVDFVRSSVNIAGFSITFKRDPK
jgi:hypothetical protein